MIRLGVFGGSFNPPHLGHLLVAELAREELGLDRVLWMPAHVAPLKSAPEIAPTDRLRMVEIAVAGNPAFGVSRVELDRGGVSYTVETLAHLHDSEDAELVLILGSDSLASFASWREPEQILSLATLAVYPRPGYPVEVVSADLRRVVKVLETPLVELSSTSIRERCRDGKTIRHMVPSGVLDYIVSNKLYGHGG